MPRVWSSATKSSSYMRRIGALGVAPTTTIFLKPRLTPVGSFQDEVSCVAGAQEAITATATAMQPSRTEVLNFMESLSFTRTRVNVLRDLARLPETRSKRGDIMRLGHAWKQPGRAMQGFGRGKSRSQRGTENIDSPGC